MKNHRIAEVSLPRAMGLFQACDVPEMLCQVVVWGVASCVAGKKSSAALKWFECQCPLRNQSFQDLLDGGGSKTSSHTISFGAVTSGGIWGERGRITLTWYSEVAQSSCAPAPHTPKAAVVTLWPTAGPSKDGASRKIKNRGETILLLVNAVNGEAWKTQSSPFLDQF